jgi:hypothetical protein
MDKVAQLCCRRFEYLANEPGGQELINLRPAEWADSEAAEVKGGSETATVVFNHQSGPQSAVDEAVPTQTTTVLSRCSQQCPMFVYTVSRHVVQG